MLRNMAQSLIQHGQITTTVPKAKTLRPYIERLITTAVKVRSRTAAQDTAGALRARRRLQIMLGDRSFIPSEHQDEYTSMSNAQRSRTMRMVSGRRHRTGEPKGRLAFTAESVTRRLIETWAPRYEDRAGGYTRVIQLAKRRIGDASTLAVIQFVGDEEAAVSLTKPGKSARRRRADARYAMAIKMAKARKSSQPQKQKIDNTTPVETDSAQSADDA